MISTRAAILIIVFLFSAACTTVAADGPGRSARKALKKGIEAYEKADYTTARKKLTEAIAGYPNYADAYFNLGQVNLKEKNIKKALDDFVKATSLDPDHTDAQLALSRIYMLARKPDAALQRVETILKRQPDNLAATLVKGSALLSKDQTDAAIQLLDPIYVKGERDVNLILLLSGAYFKKGDAIKGRVILEFGIKKNPKAAVLHLQMANLLLRGGDVKGAQASMETVTRLAPENADHAIALAQLYGQTKDDAKADRLLSQTVEKNTNNPAVRIAVANFYLEQKQIDRATDLLMKGIAAGDPGATLRLALGELYLKTGKTQAAIDLLKKDLDGKSKANEKERNDLRNALAKIYLAIKDPVSAQTYLDAILAKDPDNLQALASRGVVFKTRGRIDDAIADFNAVLARQPDFLDGYVQLADCYVLLGQLSNAKAALDKGLNIAPDNPSLRMTAYRVCLKDQDDIQAEAHLRHLVDKYPNAVDVQAELGDFYLSRKKENKAEAAYNEIIRKAPRTPLGYVKLARLYTYQKKTDLAIDQLRGGYRQSDQNSLLAAELTGALLAAERYDDVLALGNARLKAHPDEALAHDLKGKAFAKMKKYKEAQQAFEKAAALDPQWPQASNDLAALFLLQGMKDAAIRHLETALTRNPKNAVAYLTLGSLYENKDAFEKAIAVYEKGVGQVPGFWTAANRLAFLMADRNDSKEALEKALKIASAAYRMKPGQGAIVDTLGWIYFKQGDTKQALEIYEKLIAAAPEDPLINYHMGVVLEKNGDIESARKRLKTATRGDTAFMGRERAEAMLKKLGSKS
ncbi:tetratricopeptide repeat protein [Desulfosarcina cetonica]